MQGHGFCHYFMVLCYTSFFQKFLPGNSFHSPGHGHKFSSLKKLQQTERDFKNLTDFKYTDIQVSILEGYKEWPSRFCPTWIQRHS